MLILFSMFDWGDYLKLANEFSETDWASSDAEAYYRCAISRAYYSAFHKSKKFIIDKGVSLNRQNKDYSHQEIIDELNKIDSWAGSYLSKLKKNRHDSDYKNDITIGKKIAKTSITFAGNIIGQL